MKDPSKASPDHPEIARTQALFNAQATPTQTAATAVGRSREGRTGMGAGAGGGAKARHGLPPARPSKFIQLEQLLPQSAYRGVSYASKAMADSGKNSAVHTHWSRSQ